MYERFTDRARKVMQLANQEAQRFNHEYIGTEHILLGLAKEGSGVAANVLKNLDIDLRKIRLEVEKIVWAGPDMVSLRKLPLTPRAEKVVQYSREEARNLNHNYVGTEHLLLGLLREHEGVAAQILMNLGLRLEVVREEVLNLLGLDPATLQAEPDSCVAVRSSPEPTIVDLPAEVRRTLEELDAQIEQFNQAKQEAVAEQDFEKAAHLRDQFDKLRKRRETIVRGWPSSYVVDPSWLSWKGGTVAKLAQAISEERRWHDLPALATALEAAGCADPEILGHCRRPGEHAHNCWVVDLLLGKV
jgi:ATP-dependent Clp protease ATP-binding subunit ClpA